MVLDLDDAGDRRRLADLVAGADVLLDGELPPATDRVVHLPLSDHRALVVDV